MPADFDFTLHFSDKTLNDNPEAVAWLKEAEERIRQELESSYEEALGDGLLG